MASFCSNKIKLFEFDDSKSLGSEITRQDIMDEYINEVMSQANPSNNPMKIVVDCGNGSAGCIAPILFKKLGCEVIELYSDVDGNFPNHHPDPTVEENLKEITSAMKN